MANGELLAGADLVGDVSNLGWPDQQVYIGDEGAAQFMNEWAYARALSVVSNSRTAAP
jgi:hypothetical protein